MFALVAYAGPDWCNACRDNAFQINPTGHSRQTRIAPRGRCQLAARGLIAETSVPARAVSMS